MNCDTLRNFRLGYEELASAEELKKAAKRAACSSSGRRHSNGKHSGLRRAVVEAAARVLAD